jgi:hypothetical protein
VERQGEELRLAEDCEAAIRKGLKVPARKAAKAGQQRLMAEVADLFQAESKGSINDAKNER